MELTRANGNNVSINNQNTLTQYIDKNSGKLILKDFQGREEEAGDYGGASALGFMRSQQAKIEANILNAIEGVAIPDGASAEFQTTIPLSKELRSALVVVANRDQIQDVANNCVTLSKATSGLEGYTAFQPPQNEGMCRFMVSQNFNDAISGNNFFQTCSDEDGVQVAPKSYLSYSEDGVIMPAYNANANRSIGYTDASSSANQSACVLKSAYLSDKNLVLLWKKRSATVSENWTSLRFFVYAL